MQAETAEQDPTAAIWKRDSKELRQMLVNADTGDMQRRRAIVGSSLVGAASMAAVALLQTGIIRYLPDPPIKGFNSDKVNLSEMAYEFGLPDGTVSLTSLAANIPIAAFGGARRAEERP